MNWLIKKDALPWWLMLLLQVLQVFFEHLSNNP